MFIGILKFFKRVSRSNGRRGANGFKNRLEHEVENCCVLSGNACFLKCNNYIFKKNFSMEYFEFIQSYKRRTNVITRCGIPKIFERYKLDLGIICDLKGKRILPRIVEQRAVCVQIQKNQYCVNWKKSRRDGLFNGVEEIEKNFKFVQNKIFEGKLSQTIR